MWTLESTVLIWITCKHVVHAAEGGNMSLSCQDQSCVEKLSFYSENHTKLISVRREIKAAILYFKDIWCIWLEACF